MKLNPSVSAVALLAGLVSAFNCVADPVVPPKDFAYVLQAEYLSPSRPEAIRKLADCQRDWIVIDPGFAEGPDGRWTSAEIKSLRTPLRPHRQILAYLSIGEAEDYRPYWHREWDANRDGHPDSLAPAFLGNANPDWPGNYRVRYWLADWQAFILAELDAIVAQGFDGIYLDLVDAFETFEYDPVKKDWIDNRMNPDTGKTYRSDMIDWVQRIASQARQARPGFRIIPQNGSQLLVHSAYRNLIDGIGIEDLFTCGDRRQSREHIGPILSDLKSLQAEQKPVLLIEYGRSSKARQQSITGANANGFVLLLTDRLLKTLGTAAPSK